MSAYYITFIESVEELNLHSNAALDTTVTLSGLDGYTSLDESVLKSDMRGFVWGSEESIASLYDNITANNATEKPAYTQANHDFSYVETDNELSYAPAADSITETNKTDEAYNAALASGESESGITEASEENQSNAVARFFSSGFNHVKNAALYVTNGIKGLFGGNKTATEEAVKTDNGSEPASNNQEAPVTIAS